MFFCFLLHYLGFISRLYMTRHKLTGGYTELPPGSSLNIHLCDHLGKCCSQSYTGLLVGSNFFPEGHACISLKVEWRSFVELRFKIELSLVGVNASLTLGAARLHIGKVFEWVICHDVEVVGDGDIWSYSEDSEISIRF